MKENISPYRMRTANLLPKFESAKNFSPKPAPKTEPVKSAANIEAIAPAAKVAPMETYPLFDSELKPVVRSGGATRPGAAWAVTVRLPAGRLAKTEPAKMETISLFDAKPVESPAPVEATEVQPVAIQPAKTEQLLGLKTVHCSQELLPARKPILDEEAAALKIGRMNENRRPNPLESGYLPTR